VRVLGYETPQILQKVRVLGNETDVYRRKVRVLGYETFGPLSLEEPIGLLNGFAALWRASIQQMIGSVLAAWFIRVQGRCIKFCDYCFSVRTVRSLSVYLAF
jgi:hypothetical protein